jgi:hypothetical protein
MQYLLFTNIKYRSSKPSMQKDSPFALLADKSELIFLIDRLLTDLLGETRSLPKLPSPFDCKDVPNISVHDYLARNPILTKELANIHTVLRGCSWQHSSTSTVFRRTFKTLLLITITSTGSHQGSQVAHQLRHGRRQVLGRLLLQE